MPADSHSSVLAGLERIVGSGHVITDADTRRGYEIDWTARFQGSTPAVVRPATVAEVAAIVELCRLERVAIVPQGGNTGLVGGGVPLAGEIVVSLGRMTAIDDVDVAARQLTVQAGATLAAVRAAATAAGLTYPVDLGARDTATIGGNIATNAGGINLIRHGGTREQVVGIEAVLGNGQIVRRMSGLVKDNTGYHLPSLLCGSEGTLAIVTAARLRLTTRYDHRVTALLAFATVEAAVAAVARLRTAIDTLEAAELVLDAGVRLVCAAFDRRPPFARPHPVYVLVEAADVTDPTAALSGAVAALDGVEDAAVADDESRRTQLWRYREEHTLAIGTLGQPHKLDVTIPQHQLAAFMRDIPTRVSRYAPDASTWLFGHVGDGNIHVNVTGVEPDDDGIDEVVLGHVAEIGGSISAEHGIGTAKKRWLHLNRSHAEIEAMRAIKRALDPDGILNPNVLLP
ncbi:MAG: FAD-binding oxidoreductase [Ilumatobacteraceae bacterium]|nr:FAD-binding oxidoreductase [Ilumatobacteraceae bacterium]